jgi:hypothetical protein
VYDVGKYCYKVVQVFEQSKHWTTRPQSWQLREKFINRKSEFKRSGWSDKLGTTYHIFVFPDARKSREISFELWMSCARHPRCVRLEECTNLASSRPGFESAPGSREPSCLLMRLFSGYVRELGESQQSLQIPSLSSLAHNFTVRSFPPLTIQAPSFVTSVLKTGPE